MRTAPPFVGRQQELHWLEDALGEAMTGYPRVLLIEGEAGIGKTRLVEAFRAVAAHRGMWVCCSRCFEELTLPYLPFVEILRFLLEQLPYHEELSLDSDIALVNRFLQQPGTSLPASDPSTVAETDQDKLRLFLAVSRMTAQLTQQYPTLIVVDDLHWADQSSLDLFSYLVLTIADLALRESIPLLIVGTYRPPDPEERLSRFVARLQREPLCQTLTLAGLDTAAIHQLIGHMGQGRPSSLLTNAMRETTQGNPLFIQEVFHHLVQQDALQERGGDLVTSAPLPDLQLPVHVGEAMATRIRMLSEACQKVLTLASCLGERFSLQTLSVVSSMDEDTVLDLLEEGMGQRILVSEGQGFQFCHSLLRYAFYNRPSTARRQRLHRQIALTLERLHADHLEAHVLEIAHHLIRAGPTAAAKTAMSYTRRAGDQAFSFLAWGEAAHYYEAALSVAVSPDLLCAHDRAELHYRAGLAYFRAQDVSPCLDHYEKAIEYYRLHSDVQGLARTLMEKTRTLCTLAAVPYGTLAEVQWLEDILQTLSNTEPHLCGQIAAEISQAYWMAKQTDKAHAMAQRALEIGQHLEDDRLCARAGFVQALAHIQSLQVQEALESYQYAISAAQRADDIWLQGQPLQRMPLALILLGQLDEAESVALKAGGLARQTQIWADYSVVLSALASVAVARGDFAMVERRTHETMLMVTRSYHYPWGGFRALSALACAHALRGAWGEATTALDTIGAPGQLFQTPGTIIQVFVSILRQLLRAHTQAALDIPLESLVAELMGTGGFDTYSLAPLCALVEIADLIGMPRLPEPLYQALRQVAEQELLFSTGWVCLIPRALGVAATLNLHWDEAETSFQTALEVATRVGARPEQGRTSLDYARMLVARGGTADRPRAVALVQQAYHMFRALEMEPYARRAQQLATTLHVPLAPGPHQQAMGHVPRPSRRKTAILPARSVSGGAGQDSQEASLPQAAQALHIILVTDIAGSSALIERLGDVQAHELLHLHNTIIRACLRRHHGAEVTHTGDGIEASFASASSAVACAIAIQRAFAQHNRRHTAHSVDVRIGINAGEPIQTEGRLFGTAVHTAFRICSQAQPGQILVAEVIPQLAAGKGFTYVNRGHIALKGITKRVRVYEVRWRNTQA